MLFLLGVGVVFSLSSQRIFEMLILCLVVVVSLPLKEYAHAWVANRLGDPTARNLGRLTLNPFKHLDFFGSLMLILFGFGWAKPVPIQSRNFTCSAKKGMILVALAGPLSNLLLALVLMIVVKILALTFPVFFANNQSGFIFFFILNIMVSANVGLAIFHLLPIPPLDGSRILSALLPLRLYYKFISYERYINIILLVLLWTGVLSIPIRYLSGWMLTFLDFITGFLGRGW